MNTRRSRDKVRRGEEGRISARGVLDVRFRLPEPGGTWIIRVIVIVLMIVATTGLVLAGVRHPEQFRVVVGFLLQVVR